MSLPQFSNYLQNQFVCGCFFNNGHFGIVDFIEKKTNKCQFNFILCLIALCGNYILSIYGIKLLGSKHGGTVTICITALNTLNITIVFAK